MLASRLKQIWFNDQYILNVLPSGITFQFIYLSENEEEAINHHKKQIKDFLEKKQIVIDENFFMV
jgi:hypothetical protein